MVGSGIHTRAKSQRQSGVRYFHEHDWGTFQGRAGFLTQNCYDTNLTVHRVANPGLQFTKVLFLRSMKTITSRTGSTGIRHLIRWSCAVVGSAL